jgi:hypothetical protein
MNDLPQSGEADEVVTLHHSTDLGRLTWNNWRDSDLSTPSHET